MQSGTQGQGRGHVDVLNLAVMAEATTADEFTQEADRGQQQQQQQQAVVAPLLISTPSAARARMVEREREQQDRAASSSGSGQAGPGLGLGAGAGAGGGPGPSGSDVVYPRGPISCLPEAHASRKERFAELDSLQPGWEVELRSKGDTVEALFFAPLTGEKVGLYANARRQALQARKADAVKAMDV